MFFCFFSGMQLLYGLGVSQQYFSYMKYHFHNWKLLLLYLFCSQSLFYVIFCIFSYCRHSGWQLCYLQKSYHGSLYRMPSQSSISDQWRMHSSLGRVQCKKNNYYFISIWHLSVCALHTVKLMVINENFIVLDFRCYMHSLHVKMKSKGWNISEYLIFLDLPVKEKATTAFIFLWFLNVWFFFKHLIFLHYSMLFIFTVYPAGWRHDKFVPWTTENGNFKSKWNQKTFTHLSQ